MKFVAPANSSASPERSTASKIVPRSALQSSMYSFAAKTIIRAHSSTGLGLDAASWARRDSAFKTGSNLPFDRSKLLFKRSRAQISSKYRVLYHQPKSAKISPDFFVFLRFQDVIPH